mgnify:CR=1 FL=1
MSLSSRTHGPLGGSAARTKASYARRSAAVTALDLETRVAHRRHMSPSTTALFIAEKTVIRMSTTGFSTMSRISGTTLYLTTPTAC